MKIYAFILGFSLFACASFGYSANIVFPSPLSVFDDIPDVELQVGFNEIPGVDFHIWLNGRDITNKLVEEGSGVYKVPRNDIEPLIKHNENQLALLKADVENEPLIIDKATRFIVDLGAPEVAVISTPKMSGDNTLTLSVNDPVGVDRVIVNGVMAEADENTEDRYFVSIGDMSKVDVIVVDLDGNESNVFFEINDDVLKNTIAATVANDNLRPIEALVSDTILKENILDYVANPVYTGNPTDIDGNIRLSVVGYRYCL